MARRGYFERQGGEFRLRIVKPGFDADDPSVSPNNVIIDSNSKGTLSVVKSGIGVIHSNTSYQAGLWIATGWGLPYVPLCTFLFGYNLEGGIWSTYMPPGNGFINAGSRFEVTANGIYARGPTALLPAGSFPLYIHYTAYRLPAT